MPLRTISSKTSLKSYGSVDTTFFDSWEFGTDPESLNGSLINHPSVKRFENYRRITLQMILCLTFAVILFGVIVSDPLSMNIDATNLCEKVLVLMASASFIETNWTEYGKPRQQRVLRRDGDWILSLKNQRSVENELEAGPRKLRGESFRWFTHSFCWMYSLIHACLHEECTSVGRDIAERILLPTRDPLQRGDSFIRTSSKNTWSGVARHIHRRVKGGKQSCDSDNK